MATATATRTRIPSCGYDGHLENGPYCPPAVAYVTWPDGRFKPMLACRECLQETFAIYVIDMAEGRLIPMHIEPVTRPAWDRRTADIYLPGSQS
jgi:hypothetical protein